MQFTFSKLRFFLLIFAMLLMAFVLFAVGRVTGDGGSASADAGGTSAAGGGSAAGGAMSPTAIANRNKKIAQITQVQGLLGIKQAPGQAQAMRAVNTSNSLAAMKQQNGSPQPGAVQAAPSAVAPGAVAGVAPNAASQPGQQAVAPNAVPSGAAVVPGAAPVGAPAAEAAPQVPVHVAVATISNPGEEPFVLQLGAFREQKAAKDLQAALQQKNVPTTILNMVDEDQRTWHMVRFGGYKDMETASKAATKFTAEQGILAIVRRSDSL